MTDTFQVDLEACKRSAAQKLDELRRDVPYTKASIQLLNEDFRTLFVCRGFNEDSAIRPLLRPVSTDPLVKGILQHGEPVYIPDTSREPLWVAWETTKDVRCWIGAPIGYDNRDVGFMTLDFAEPLAAFEEVLARVERFANDVAPILSRARLLDGHVRLARDMTIVRDIIRIIAEKLHTGGLLDEIARQVATHLDCTHCTIFLPKKIDGEWRLVPQSAGRSEETKSRTFRLGEGLAGWVFQSGESLLVPNVADDPRFAAARVPRGESGRSMLVTPIKVGDKTIGVISADQDVPGWFSQNDANLLDALGQQAGIAIQRSLALTLLQDIAKNILTLTAVKHILEQVVLGAIDLVNATTGVIYLLDQAKRNVVREFHPPDFDHETPRLDNPRGITRTVIDTGKPVRVPDTRAATHVDVHPNLRKIYKSMIAVPLKVSENVIGVFFVDDVQSHLFTEMEETLLVTLASHAAIAIENADLHEDLRKRVQRLEELDKQMERMYGLVTGGAANLVDQVLDLVGSGARAMLGDEVSPTINLLDPDTGAFELPRAFGPLGAALRDSPRATGGTGQYVIATRQPLYLPDVNAPPAGVPTIRRASLDLGVKSFAALPLLCGDKALGVLFINSPKALGFSDHERQTLERFAAQASRAIESYRVPGAVAALREKARDFFISAGRDSVRIVGSLELAVPGPVRVAAAAEPTVYDVKGLESLLRAEQAGYFVFAGELPARTSEELDNLRKRGNPVVPLSDAVMTAALADRRARTVLADLERENLHTPNLFELRCPLIDERFLFGRRQLLAEVGAAVSTGQHVLLFGFRKSGKTSFLNILRQRLSRHPLSWIDLQEYDTHTTDWPLLLFQSVIAAFDHWGRSVFPKNWPAEPSAAPANASHFKQMLLKRRRWQVDRGRSERLVIVFDEIERMFPRAPRAEQVRQFVRVAGALRSVVQDAAVSLVAADLRSDVNKVNRLDAFGESTTNPFYAFFKEVPLPLLSRAALGDMVTSIGRAMGIGTVDPDFIAGLAAQTGGHPFLSRLVAAAAYDRRTDDRLDADSLAAGLEYIEDLNIAGDFFTENVWGELREEEKQVLLECAGLATPSPAVGASERAALIMFGLVRDGRIQIGQLDSWLQAMKNPSAKAI